MLIAIFITITTEIGDSLKPISIGWTMSYHSRADRYMITRGTPHDRQENRRFRVRAAQGRQEHDRRIFSPEKVHPANSDTRRVDQPADFSKIDPGIHRCRRARSIPEAVGFIPCQATRAHVRDRRD